MRLGDLDALRKQMKELLDLSVKRVNDTPNNSPCYRMYVAQESERARLIDLIDKAPTIKTFTLADIEEQYLKGLEKGLSEWETERPQGEWKETGYETGALGITYRQTQCSNCGWEHALPMWWNFCPNCGADMRKGGAE